MTTQAHDFDATPSDKVCPFAGLSEPRNSTSSSTEVGSIYSTLSDSRTSHETTTTQPTSQHSMDAPKPRCPVVFTQEVDPILIKTSLDDRIAYLTDFLNFTSHDADTIKKVAPHVTGLIPGLVDDLYAKLFEFDITKKIFMNRNQVGDAASSFLRVRLSRWSFVLRDLTVRCLRSSRI